MNNKYEKFLKNFVEKIVKDFFDLFSLDAKAANKPLKFYLKCEIERALFNEFVFYMLQWGGWIHYYQKTKKGGDQTLYVAAYDDEVKGASKIDNRYYIMYKLQKLSKNNNIDYHNSLDRFIDAFMQWISPIEEEYPLDYNKFDNNNDNDEVEGEVINMDYFKYLDY